jgi:hypothetical protein
VGRSAGRELEGVGFRVASRKLPVSFTLPDGEPAKVELLDVAGRRVVSRVVKDSGMESQTVNLAAGREVPPGIYVVRLIHGSGTVTAKACVIR